MDGKTTTEFETKFVDRGGWESGPWDDEPDRAEFEHAGLACLLSRAPRTGNWCGYVALPAGHRLFAASYDRANKEVDVHGTLTYAAPCEGRICHAADAGAPAVWWLGFDCGHGDDLSPGGGVSSVSGGSMGILGALLGFGDDGEGDHYWTIDEARAETMRLAEQLAAVADAKGGTP